MNNRVARFGYLKISYRRVYTCFDVEIEGRQMHLTAVASINAFPKSTQFCWQIILVSYKVSQLRGGLPDVCAIRRGHGIKINVAARRGEVMATFLRVRSQLTLISAVACKST